MKNNNPWFPKYLHINDESTGLNKTLVFYKECNYWRNAEYYDCAKNDTVTLYYDGYQYFIRKKPVYTYEASPKSFLNDNNYGHGEFVFNAYKEAFADMQATFPGTIKYDITETNDGYFHTETFVYQPNIFAMWNGTGQRMDYFPKYIRVGNNQEHPNIFVHINQIDEKTAHYWKCSGEWGMVLNYSNKSYRIVKQDNTYDGTEDKIDISEATASEFIKYNDIFKLDSTKQLYLDAWETIKNENPLAFKINFETTSSDFTCVWVDYNNDFKKWAV